ncbi:hypothetical protein CTheo_8502 [Ceratobasidium theobromae]|uniref:Uncharacterized protein n=1 Tax=Ceratobasidium theobromae TaxID=1582974 RepID=A0A5N5Q9H8_9AGAM|nr:hypothetical protein CTheo_8502 [Ceratobasidium theobromae]
MPAQPRAGGDTDREDALPDEHTLLEEWKEVVIRLQLTSNKHKCQLAEVTHERDELASHQTGRRKCCCCHHQPSEPTPEDPKYELAGKRCALFWMLWVVPEIKATEIEATYSDACWYDKKSPEMLVQGKKKDILTLMLESCIASFECEEHFQKVELISDHKQQAEHDEFKILLGYSADGSTPGECYPALAPVLYLDNNKGNNSKLFRSPYLKKAFQAYLFGPSSVSDGHSTHKGGQKKLAEVLGLKTITPGAIAAAAVFTRWCISPDEEFSPEGAITKINWKEDYQRYKKILIMAIHSEKGVFERTQEDDPATRNNAEEPQEDPDIAAALAEIEDFAQNN